MLHTSIGEVTVSDDGPMTTHQAAYALIANHDTPGTYEFPMSSGAICEVTVVYREPQLVRTAG